MKLDLAGKSLLLLAVSVLLLIGLTLFESALAGMSPGAERAITFLLLVLPAAAGFGLGVMSLIQRGKEGREVRRRRSVWLAVIGAVLNAVFALFHMAIILFAG